MAASAYLRCNNCKAIVATADQNAHRRWHVHHEAQVQSLEKHVTQQAVLIGDISSAITEITAILKRRSGS